MDDVCEERISSRRWDRLSTPTTSLPVSSAVRARRAPISPSPTTRTLIRRHFGAWPEYPVVVETRVILSAHQPAYLPWLGYFKKIAMSDVFCVLDNVQFKKFDYINRNRIRDGDGATWLSVPVHRKGHSMDRISEMQIVQDGWQKTHLKTIRLVYSKSTYFDRYFGSLEDILLKRHSGLSELTADLLSYLLEALSLKANVVRASDYSVPGKKNEYLINLCREFGASTYVFGSLGRGYADERLFAEAEITIRFLDYRHPVYRQQREPFLPNLSIIDLLFNEGPNSLEILTNTDDE